MFGRFFRKPKRVEGKCVDLMLDQHVDASKYNQMVPSDLFGIYLHGTNIRVGSCDLRYGMNEELYYAGNIGYNVLSVYRGHGYAYQACLHNRLVCISGLSAHCTRSVSATTQCAEKPAIS